MADLPDSPFDRHIGHEWGEIGHRGHVAVALRERAVRVHRSKARDREPDGNEDRRGRDGGTAERLRHEQRDDRREDDEVARLVDVPRVRREGVEQRKPGRDRDEETDGRCPVPPAEDESADERPGENEPGEWARNEPLERERHPQAELLRQRRSEEALKA